LLLYDFDAGSASHFFIVTNPLFGMQFFKPPVMSSSVAPTFRPANAELKLGATSCRQGFGFDAFRDEFAGARFPLRFQIEPEAGPLFSMG
jgi:hypothetical protein